MTNLLTFQGLRTVKAEVSAAHAAISLRHQQARDQIEQAEHHIMEALKALQSTARRRHAERR